MAGAVETGKGGKGEAELNLVPFIDLLSACICFLLIAAAWLEVGTLQVKQEFGVDAPDADAAKVEIEARLVESLSTTVTLKQGGKTLRMFGVAAATREALQADLAAKLRATLHELAIDTDEQIAARVAQATIVADGKAPYSTMVTVMDALRRQHIVNLAVAAPRGKAS
jgi:biopolymer transport protein ExbD